MAASDVAAAVEATRRYGNGEGGCWSNGWMKRRGVLSGGVAMSPTGRCGKPRIQRC